MRHRLVERVFSRRYFTVRYTSAEWGNAKFRKEALAAARKQAFALRATVTIKVKRGRALTTEAVIRG